MFPLGISRVKEGAYNGNAEWSGIGVSSAMRRPLLNYMHERYAYMTKRKVLTYRD